jgi:signal transduction histidine kinase
MKAASIKTIFNVSCALAFTAALAPAGRADVWTVNPKNDDLSHMLLRFSEVAQEMLEPKGIAYHITISPNAESLKLSMEHRREIYLIYKEWLNNIVKYAGCTQVDIQFLVKGKNVQLIISDNGKGFDAGCEYSGNGLKNMAARAKAVNGSFVVRTEKGAGAVIELKVPLA